MKHKHNKNLNTAITLTQDLLIRPTQKINIKKKKKPQNKSYLKPKNKKMQAFKKKKKLEGPNLTPSPGRAQINKVILSC